MRGAQRVSRCGSQGGGRGKEERRGKEKVSGGSGGDVHAKFDEQRRIGDERKISVRKSSRKTGLNKTSVKEGLISFYEGNEQNICEIGTRKPRRLHCVTFACDIFFILLR